MNVNYYFEVMSIEKPEEQGVEGTSIEAVVEEDERAEDLKPFSIRKGHMNYWKEVVDKNPYGIGNFYIHRAARWANLMEEKMAEGDLLEAVAKKTFLECDPDHKDAISGYGFNFIADILSEVWEHNKEFDRWRHSFTEWPQGIKEQG